MAKYYLNLEHLKDLDKDELVILISIANLIIYEKSENVTQWLKLRRSFLFEDLNPSDNHEFCTSYGNEEIYNSIMNLEEYGIIKMDYDSGTRYVKICLCDDVLIRKNESRLKTKKQ